MSRGIITLNASHAWQVCVLKIIFLGRKWIARFVWVTGSDYGRKERLSIKTAHFWFLQQNIFCISFSFSPQKMFLVVSHDSIRGWVRPSVRRLVHRSVRRSVRNAFVSAGRDELANDLFRVHELVQFSSKSKSSFYWYAALHISLRIPLCRQVPQRYTDASDWW